MKLSLVQILEASGKQLAYQHLVSSMIHLFELVCLIHTRIKAFK